MQALFCGVEYANRLLVIYTPELKQLLPVLPHITIPTKPPTILLPQEYIAILAEYLEDVKPTTELVRQFNSLPDTQAAMKDVQTELERRLNLRKDHTANHVAEILGGIDHGTVVRWHGKSGMGRRVDNPHGGSQGLIMFSAAELRKHLKWHIPSH